MNNQIPSLAIIIFGATGDLAKKRLFPSLYYLFSKKKIENFSIIGTALEDISVDEILNKIKEHISNLDFKTWDIFSKKIHYLKTDLTKNDDYKKIKNLINKIENETNLTKRLIYCSVAPNLFKPITKYLVKNEIIEKQVNQKNNWHRIVYEKPFGIDLKSAKQINNFITKKLDENQIFRIDHFLADIMVRNIPTLKFKNQILQPWDKNNIEQVNIILTDNTKNLENRGNFYDKVGTLLDVVQNHMIQIMTLIAINEPNDFNYESISAEKIKILKKIEFIDGILGQYLGYKQEEGISKNSTTDTFSALLFKIKSSQWKNTPFFIKTGKCLDKLNISAQLKFKNSNLKKYKNYLNINIEIDPGIEININIENSENKLISIPLNFNYNSTWPNVPTPNELIFEKILIGDKSISVPFEEIKYAWKIIDKIKSSNLPLYSYTKGNSGPVELKEFQEKNNLNNGLINE